MNAAIILPGSTAEIPPASIVIGVNHAATGYTHAIALDLSALAKIQPVEGVKRIISKTTIQQSQQQTGEIPPHDGVVEDLFAKYPRKVPWSAHTLTAALVLAVSLGAKVINVIGLDVDGPNDIEGNPLPAEGGETRHDLILFEQTAKYVMEQGVGILYDDGVADDSIPLPAAEDDGDSPNTAA